MARVPKELEGRSSSRTRASRHKEVWRQNFQPKMEDAFAIADNDHPEHGLQIAVETSLLFEKMEAELAKEMKRAGRREKGNPILYPFPFRWDYNGTEGSVRKKYDATALTNVRLTPAIEKLIRDTEPPEGGAEQAARRATTSQTHRARLERYAVGGGKLLPFDGYFAEALKVEASRPEPAAAAERPAPEVGRERPAPAPRAPAPAAPPPDDEEVDCDAVLPSGKTCGAVMKMSDPVCPSCGFVYEVVGAPPPPPARPTRSQARAARAAAPAPAPAARGDLGAAAPPVDDLAPGGGYPGDESDDIPFIANTLSLGEDWGKMREYEVPTRFLPRV